MATMSTQSKKQQTAIIESDDEDSIVEDQDIEQDDDNDDDDVNDDEDFEDDTYTVDPQLNLEQADPEPTDSALLADIDNIADEEDDDFLVSHDTLSIHTTPYLTKYEMTKVLALRSQQLLTGAPSTVEASYFLNNEYPIEPYTIAYMELKMSRLPLIIGRRLPNNTIIRIPVHALMIPE